MIYETSIIPNCKQPGQKIKQLTGILLCSTVQHSSCQEISHMKQLKVHSRLHKSHIETYRDSAQFTSTPHLGGKDKGRGKVFPVYVINTYRGNRGIAPLILNLGTRWR
jgi:hypothetical protein